MVKALILSQIALLLKRYDYHIVSLDVAERSITFRKRRGETWELSIYRGFALEPKCLKCGDTGVAAVSFDYKNGGKAIRHPCDECEKGNNVDKENKHKKKRP